MALLALLGFAGQTNAPAQARNPIIWADVPDVFVIRVGDTYYMSSTTMHMSPGIPIMKSKDLVNWRLIGYAYSTLDDSAAPIGKLWRDRSVWAPKRCSTGTSTSPRASSSTRTTPSAPFLVFKQPSPIWSGFGLKVGMVGMAGLFRLNSYPVRSSARDQGARLP